MENSDSNNVDKQQLKRARITALVLAAAIVFSLLTLVYAFMQKTEADKARAHAEGTMMQLKQMIESSGAEEHQKRIEQQKLNALLGLCETGSCRRGVLLRYFGEVLSKPCGNCDNCKNPPKLWDGTLEAHKALSAVYRTGQRFGAQYVAEILRGVVTERNDRFGHTKLAVFGVGKDLSQPAWMSVVRQLVSGGYLSVSSDGYGSLLLTDAARELLRSKRQLLFRADIAEARPARRGKGAVEASRGAREKAGAGGATLGAPDADLFEVLRAKRLELAQAQNVPPYVVFPDAALHDMVAKMPQTLTQMRQVHGVGEVKLTKYGQVFLELLRQVAEGKRAVNG